LFFVKEMASSSYVKWVGQNANLALNLEKGLKAVTVLSSGKIGITKVIKWKAPHSQSFFGEEANLCRSLSF